MIVDVTLRLHLAAVDDKQAAEVVKHWFAGDAKAAESIYDSEFVGVSFPERSLGTSDPETVPEPELSGITEAEATEPVTEETEESSAA